MTRSSKLALVTLLAGLLSFTSFTAVSADTTCTGRAQEHCEQMAAADDAIVYHIAAVSPLHILASNGIGQEHFEAMTAEQFALFGISAPTPVHVLSSTGMGQEHFEAITAQASNP